MKPSQHIELNKDYYTHYFLYYTYYFECLSRIEQLVTSTYAMQADIQRIYERYHAIASRRKLSFLSQGPNSCPLLLYYSYYVTIIFYYTHYFKTRKCNLGAYSLQKTGQSAHPTQGISEYTNQEHQRLNQAAPKRLFPWVLQLQLQPRLNRSHGCTPANYGLQSINSGGNGCSLFLPHVISYSEIDTNLHK